MSIATLSIDLVAKFAQFEKDLTRVATASEASATRITRAMDIAKSAVVDLAGLVTVDVFADMVTRAADYSDQIGKMAQKIGTTTEEFSALAYAARLADVSNETLAGGLKKLSVEIADGGTKLAQLGVKTTDASGKLRSNADIMGDVAERFATMKDGAIKTAWAVELFGKSGAEMIPLLNAGRDGLKESADEAQRFGLIVSKEAAVAAEQFNDNLTRLKASTEGAAVALTSDLVKGLGEATRAFLEANAEGGKMAGIIAGVQTLLTGTDRYKNDKAMVEQTEALLKAQNELDRAKGAKVVLPGRVLVAQAELDKAKEAIRLTQQYRKVLDEADAQNAPKPKTDGPPLPPPKAPKVPRAVKDVTGENERALAQYVKGLEGATEKTLELTEADKARNFLATIGRTGEVAQVRELVLGMAAELDVKRAATEAEKERIAAVQGATRIADQAVAQRAAELDAMVNANATLRTEIELLGKDEAARTALTLKKQDQAIADQELALISARNIENNEVQIQQMERELRLMTERRSLTADRATAQIAADKVVDEKAISQRLSGSIVDGLTNGFRDGKSIGTVFLDELKAQFGKAVLQPIIKPITEAGGAAISGLMTKLLGSFAFADGGIMTGRGPMPLRAYATGGVASTPQLALYGEGSMPEAFVPLPDGRTIPVSVRYGSDGAPVAAVPLPDGRQIPVTLDMPQRDAPARAGDGGQGARAPAAFARGGIMTERGPMPLRAYATGGVASTPQIAMYGEGSTPEAFVPLPDGRTIPVTMSGGGGAPTVVVNINNTVGDVASVSTVTQGMKAVRAQIISELSRGQRFGGAYA